MTQTTEARWYNGHKYESVGPMPCPMPGYEDCTCVCSYEGKPAYWMDGIMYVMVQSETPAQYDWVKRVPKADAEWMTCSKCGDSVEYTNHTEHKC